MESAADNLKQKTSSLTFEYLDTLCHSLFLKNEFITANEVNILRKCTEFRIFETIKLYYGC